MEASAAYQRISQILMASHSHVHKALLSENQQREFSMQDRKDFKGVLRSKPAMQYKPEVSPGSTLQEESTKDLEMIINQQHKRSAKKVSQE